MSDIIKLLPDSVVNQIAAGEVIQRPASVVKELIDNAIDAKATQIKLVIEDGGKTLIQVSDNGVGMSPTDARMAFERHATSKIKKAEDLFSIETKGFRGEAMASIASVAQVEMKTKQTDQSLGTKIAIAESQIKSAEPTASSDGTVISVKHLFYNIPARRKFLKSDTIELRHIHDEFVHQALSYPEIAFSYFHNENEIYQLPAGSLRQRIIGIYGKKYKDELLAIQEETDVMDITGFVGTPTVAKKVRGEQLLFVNRRYIKSNYLQHAIQSAYEGLVSGDQFPFYILFLQIDPSKIDVNVHPTKQEIKFEDEKLIYHFLKVAIRHVLGKQILAPQLDFSNVDKGIEQLLSSTSNTSSPSAGTGTSASDFRWKKDSSGFSQQVSWVQMAEARKQHLEPKENVLPFDELKKDSMQLDLNNCFQLNASYIVVASQTGLLVIDQQHAHERVLYEHFLKLYHQANVKGNPLLFPLTIHLNKPDALLLKQLLPQLLTLGVSIEEFGGESFILHSFPEFISDRGSETDWIQKILDQYRLNLEFELSVEDNLARSTAMGSSLKKGKILSKEEMINLTEQLFKCQMPYNNPNGKKVYLSLALDEIQNKLK